MVSPPRSAAASDLPAIGRLGALLMRMHHEFESRRFMAAPPHVETRYASFLGEELEKPNIIVLVAEREGEVIGYVYAGVEGYDYMALRGPAGVGYDLMVDPAHRGKGVGRMLLEAMLSAFTARGVPRVALSTAEQNSSARRLLARAGFRPTMVEMTRELDRDPS
jgi:ribosomal protein S18 acetylase RimI-like enzyme